MVSFGRIILFSSNEKFDGTKNSFFELDKNEAHHEYVLLLKIANFEFSSFLIGNRNMRSEIKNDKIPPKNNFMNNHDPDLDISRLYTRVSVTSGLNELGDVCIKSCSSLLYS